jgi:hypothetical protein
MDMLKFIKKVRVPIMTRPPKVHKPKKGKGSYTRRKSLKWWGD